MGKKRLLSIGILLALALGLAVPARAHAVPDVNRTGCSITVKMTYKGKDVSGGTLTLYRVGDIVEEDGDFVFQLNSAFIGSGVSVADPGSQDAAKKLADWAKKNPPATGKRTKVIDKGTVTFQGNLDLPTPQPGLYLLVQDLAAKGYSKVNPFLVSLPAYDEEAKEYRYTVDASPKVDLEPAPTTKPTTAPTKPGGKLPQTGQLSWLVPVLALSGAALLAAGVTQSRKRRGEK